MKNTSNIRFRSNRVRDVRERFHEELDPVYGHGEVSVFCRMLFEAFFGWSHARLLASSGETLDQSDLLRFHWALEDLLCHRPIQYIIGYTDFCGCRIEVTPDVLIPRPETASMVSWIVGSYAGKPAPHHIIDLCTGSGCIAIALKKAFPEAAVTAVDLSSAALKTACRNAKANEVDIAFVEQDVLGGLPALQPSSLDLIVSNPPYVRSSEQAQMQRNVLDYEPPMALFVPDADPLRFYRAIAGIACRCLAQDGKLVVEINEALATETADLLAPRFISTLHNDVHDRPRWVSSALAV